MTDWKARLCSRDVRSPRWRSLLGPLAVGCLVSGCITVGPNYVRPSVDVAEQWIDADDPRIKTEPAAYRDWWTIFNDPVLNALVGVAYKQNLTLHAAGVRILEARAALGMAVGRQYPQTQEATGQISRIWVSENESPLPIAPPATAFDLWRAGFDVGWELDFWGKLRRGVESANADLGASIANYDDILVSLVAEVAATYARIRTFEERLKVARENVEIQERSFRITDVRFRHGLVTELDVQQSKAVLWDTEASIPNLEGRLRQAHNALGVLLGVPPAEVQGILERAGPIPTAPPDVAVGMPVELLRRRPDIRRAERELAAQSARIGLAKSDFYPQIALAGSFNLAAENAADVFKGSSFTGFAGPAFVWPLFNYGRITNHVRVQDARFQQLAVNYHNTVLRATQEVEDAIVAFLQAQEERRFLGESVDASKRSVDLALIQYREGFIDFTRVLQSQELLVRLQDRLAETTGAIVTNLIAVYKALGGGWQIRDGEPFVPGEIQEQMRERTNWGGLMEVEAQQPKPVDILPGWPDW